MSCLLCGRDLHNECARFQDRQECCGTTSLCQIPTTPNRPSGTGQHPTAVPTRRRGTPTAGQESDRSQGTTGSRSSNDSITDLDTEITTPYTKEYKDPESTGRKQAEKLYPLNRDADCEWKNLANVGGGKYPIVGCISGKQTNRHHGPDKSTLNNEQGNVHKICATCHNTWHEWNDAVPDATKLHEPRVADPTELVIWNDKRLRPKAPESRYRWHREREVTDAGSAD